VTLSERNCRRGQHRGKAAAPASQRAGAGNDLVLGGQARDVLVGGFAHEAPAATPQDHSVSVDGRDSHDIVLDAWSLHGSVMGDNGAEGQSAEPVSDWLFLHEQGTGPLDLAFALQGGDGFGDIG
jgi:hypothetical protein